jgi:hypothetical protein
MNRLEDGIWLLECGRYHCQSVILDLIQNPVIMHHLFAACHPRLDLGSSEYVLGFLQPHHRPHPFFTGAALWGTVGSPMALGSPLTGTSPVKKSGEVMAGAGWRSL